MPQPSSALRLALLAASILILPACGGDGSGAGSVDVPFAGSGPPADENPGLPPLVSLAPESLGDGWTTSSPLAEDIDAEVLGLALDLLRNGRYPGVDSLVVVRRGRLVAEGYFNGFGRDTLHDLRSTGKSFTSALTGIAIEQGLIGLDDPVSAHLPRFDDYANMSARKRGITLRHLLNMNSGLECNDWLEASAGNEERMYNRRDWVGFIMDLPMVFEPGRVAAYCTGGVVVLGHIVSLASGMTLDDYAQTYLFDPLGIRESRWRRSPDGRATGGGGLRLTPRDAAKFGTLFLQNGSWNDQRILPEAWAERSRQSVNRLGDYDYGFLWWKHAFNHESGAVESFFTAGNGGNFIFVLPDLELVVVFTGSNYNSRLMDQPYDILQSRVLPAVQ